MSLSSALTILKHEISPTSSEQPPKPAQPSKAIAESVVVGAGGGVHEIHIQSVDTNVLSNGNSNNRKSSDQQPRESSGGTNNGTHSQQLLNSPLNNGNGVLDQPAQGSDGALDKVNSKPDTPAGEHSK